MPAPGLSNNERSLSGAAMAVIFPLSINHNLMPAVKELPAVGVEKQVAGRISNAGHKLAGTAIEGVDFLLRRTGVKIKVASGTKVPVVGLLLSQSRV